MADRGSNSGSSSHSHSTDDKSSTTLGSEVGPAAGTDVQKMRLAESEHRAVVRSKVVVILTLLGAATVLGLVTHSMITREETADFKSQVCVKAVFCSVLFCSRFLSNLLTNKFLFALLSSMTTQQNLSKSPTKNQQQPLESSIA
jgi:hypothetical protein